MTETAEKVKPSGASFTDADGVVWATLKEVVRLTDNDKRTERHVRDTANDSPEVIRSYPRKSKSEKLYVHLEEAKKYVNEVRGPLEPEDEKDEDSVVVPLVIVERENAMIEKLEEARLAQGRAEGAEQSLRDALRDKEREVTDLRAQLADRFSTAIAVGHVVKAITEDGGREVLTVTTAPIQEDPPAQEPPKRKKFLGLF